MPTEYKFIKGYDNKYIITPEGDIYSLAYYKYGKVWPRKEPIKLKPTISNVGYAQVGLLYRGKVKFYRVHRLVAEYFIDNPNNLPEVNHKDENKLNNDVSNLEWCSVEYNRNYGDRGAKIANGNHVTAEIRRMMNWEKWIPTMFDNVNKTL